MLKIYLTDTSSMTDETMERWLPRIVKEKADRLRAMAPEKARASMGGELLLRYGAMELFHVDPSTIETSIAPLGKPFVSSHPYIHFNMSHSGTLCLCAVSDRPVGVDIQHQKKSRCEKLAERFFSEKERQLFQKMGATQDAFFTLWARKEALSKLSGEGLRDFSSDGPEGAKIMLEIAYEDCRLCVVQTS